MKCEWDDRWAGRIMLITADSDMKSPRNCRSTDRVQKFADDCIIFGCL